ncbi:MAG: putative proline hydroxylase [Gemmatimonadetes bacterium]|nr:putative proline hydroxylase [Gemmatimonadota bacterium]
MTANQTATDSDQPPRTALDAAGDGTAYRRAFAAATPYQHLVIDNFFDVTNARQLSADIPEFESPLWFQYNNAVESKRVLNHWDRFPAATYSLLAHLNSATFIRRVECATGHTGLIADSGLHGGGWHMHARGGKLNVHLDYALHPKLRLERRLNLIVYLTEGWRPEWGGGLGLWTHDETANAPATLAATIDCLFNRAVLFDTTGHAWHGLPDPIGCPENTFRRSLAVYYLSEARPDVPPRLRAQFAPTKEQADDPDVLALIARRARP